MRVDQASGLEPLPGAPLRASEPGAAAAARCIAVVSGKGGVGKTNLVANLAVAAARRGARVLLVDGDLGLSNVDVLLGLAPKHNVSAVLEGRCPIADALVIGPRGVHVLPAASARSELAALSGAGLERLVKLLWREAIRYDLVLIDAGAGVGPAVVGLSAACRRALLVTTPEPTSLADAYAMLKVLRGGAPKVRPELVVNAASREREALATHAQLERMTQRFLGVGIPYRAYLPRDPRLAEAVARQRAVVEMFPSTPWSRRLLAFCDMLLRERASPAADPSHP